MTDLASFRAYGALFADDREGGLNAIRAEARRMQERVTFEKEIRLAMDREQKEAGERDPEDPEDRRPGRVVAIASRRRRARTLRPRVYPFPELHTTAG